MKGGGSNGYTSIRDPVLQTRDPPAALPRDVAVVALGDSVTARDGYVDMLARELGWTLTNRAASGTVLQNSADASGLPRRGNGRDTVARRAFSAGLPDFVVDGYGGFNDMRYVAAPSTFGLPGFIDDKREYWNILREAGIASQRILCFTPWYITDAGLLRGGGGFAGQSRERVEAYVEAMQMLAREYGMMFYDQYSHMLDAGGAALIGHDGIHPHPEGSRVIADGAKAATPFNRLVRPRDIAAHSPAPGMIRIGATAPDAIIARYEVAWGISGSHAYPNHRFVPDPKTELRGLLGGTYRVRMRAWHRFDGVSPWAFGPDEVVVG